MKKKSPRRIAASIEISLWKKIKEPVKIVYGLMSTEMNQQAFLDIFKYCYPNLWNEVEIFHKRMLLWEKNRIKHNHYSIYCYESAEVYLCHKAKEYDRRAKLKKNVYDNAKGRLEKERIRKISLAKLNAAKRKEAERERYIQHTTPKYVELHISEYFNSRKRNALDIDSRYLIIHELAKYKCDATIQFLKKLVQCEKNLPLQHYSWQCLNELGVVGVHKGRRQGKKSLSQTKSYTEITTPQELLLAIYNSPLEKMKQYDIFLSHSYQDKAKLLELKDLLNSNGLNVFLDWVNDKDELQRQLACKETAAVIAERMLSCKVVLYIHTDSCLTSKWTPWELGFAYANRKTVYVLDLTDGADRPEYLELYDKALMVDGDIIIETDTGTRVKLKECFND